MTSIDFHFNTPHRLQYACRLTRKILRANMIQPSSPLVVFCANAARLNEFDELLWSFSQSDFIAHGRHGTPVATKSPVVLINQDEKLPSHHLLLNLDDDAPSFFSRFTRLFEVVSTDENDRIKARERFSFYRDRGYPLTRHDLAKGSA